MAREAAAIDISAYPDLVRLIHEVKRTRRTQAIQENGKTVALLVPAGGPRRGTRPRRQLVDTSALPPVPYRTVDEMIADRPLPTPRTFTDEEIKAALEEERVTAWRRKSS